MKDFPILALRPDFFLLISFYRVARTATDSTVGTNSPLEFCVGCLAPELRHARDVRRVVIAGEHKTQNTKHNGDKNKPVSHNQESKVSSAARAEDQL